MVKWLKNEFWYGYTLFEKLFMLSMVLLQVVVYCFVPDTLIGMICGIAGCICVVLTAKGKYFRTKDCWRRRINSSVSSRETS